MKCFSISLILNIFLYNIVLSDKRVYLLKFEIQVQFESQTKSLPYSVVISPGSSEGLKSAATLRSVGNQGYTSLAKGSLLYATVALADQLSESERAVGFASRYCASRWNSANTRPNLKMDTRVVGILV